MIEQSSLQLLSLNASNKDQYFDFWVKTYQHAVVNPFMFKPQRAPQVQMRELYENYLSKPNVVFFVGLDKANVPVGSCRVTFLSGVRSHVAMINAFFIDPAHHGKKYGKAMLEAVEKFIRSRECIHQIELAYEGDNLIARGFYQRNFGYQTKLIYSDWWRRDEPELKKTHVWTTEERCCVKYLTSVEPADVKPEIVMATKNYSLDERYVVEVYQGGNDLEAVISTYEQAEQQEIWRLLKANQEAYVLKDKNNNGKIVAVINFKPYDEPRLSHAVTIPCVVFTDEVSGQNLACFVDASMQKYREKFGCVFHFACSEEDTEDLFYGNQMSKIQKLTLVLQLAGFKFLGIFENYFGERSFVGRHLLGFECCFLGLEDAIRCVEVSLVLNAPQKLAITQQLKNYQSEPEQFSRHAQREIYQCVRAVAYPQDYKPEEMLSFIRNTANGLYSPLKDRLIEIISHQSRNQKSPGFMDLALGKNISLRRECLMLGNEAIEIRKLNSADTKIFDEVIALNLSEWGKDFFGENARELTIEHYNDPSRITLVAVSKDKIIGTASVVTRDVYSVYPEAEFSERKLGYFSRLVIEESHREKGIGRRLLALCDEVAREHELNEMFLLLTEARDSRLYNFYIKENWRCEKEIEREGFGKLLVLTHLVLAPKLSPKK